jgi:hypothetical protein
MKILPNKIITRHSQLILQIVGFLFILNDSLLAQEKDQYEKYKIVLRMKLRIDVNPLNYMDEPKSAVMNSVDYSSIAYMDLVDLSASEKAINLRGSEIEKGAKEFSKIKYNQKMPTKKYPNIRYNYFSSSMED